MRASNPQFLYWLELTLCSHDLFDEYTRRQYQSKLPDANNPFGNEEVPAKFADFDVFTKVRRVYVIQWVPFANRTYKDTSLATNDSIYYDEPREATRAGTRTGRQ